MTNIDEWIGPNKPNDSHQVQRSEEWYSYRLRHIGASEVPLLMGESDWGTIHDLWLKKTGQMVEPRETNWAMQRGIDAEPRIKELYELHTLAKAVDRVIEFSDWPILSASLDGWVEETNRVVEFKFVSKAKHELAKKGEIPICYKGQIQAQLLVAGSQHAHYVSYQGSPEEIAIVDAYPDLEYQAKIIERAKWFWKHVEKGTPPVEAQHADPQLQEWLEGYANSMKQAKLAMDSAEAYKGLIAARVTEDAQIGAFKCTWVSRRGNVQYDKIPELNFVDLEKYRAEGTTYIKISGEKL